jgi:SAM-dependent methyltransferase
MCTPRCVDFVRSALTPTDVSGKRVLEVGAYDVNGSIRGVIEAFGPSSYVGTDMKPGPGVDEAVRVEDLAMYFREAAFDVVVSTEMLEHVLDWRAAIRNLKAVLRPGGVMILTTRSPGFPFHGYPGDYWRLTVDDARCIFSDMCIERLEQDSPESPGILIRASRTNSPIERDSLNGIALYSVVFGRRRLHWSRVDIVLSHALSRTKRMARRLVPHPVWRRARAFVHRHRTTALRHGG